jgi:C4-dicarboxylate-specific signal transduction histidine kinase
MAEDTHRFRVKLEGSTALRYALAPVCIVVAVVLQISLIGPLPVGSPSVPPIHPTGLFQVCIVVAAWFGGAGPGFLAALLATLVLPLLIAMNYPLIAGFFDLPRFVAFGITGLAVGWGTTFRRRAEAALRRSERELRQARNELEMQVLEQTAALRRSRALLAEAQQLSQTGSFGWQVPTGEVLWSEETFRIFQYDRTTQPTMERALQRVHPEDAALVQQTIERASQDGKDFEHACRLLMPDGSLKYVQVLAHAVRDEAGSVEFVGAVMDVTERKQAEEALRKVQGELAHVTRVMTMGELAASIAHEINQPLAAIVTNGSAGLRWLAGAPPHLEDAREVLQCIIDDAQRAGEIISRIRALLRHTAPEPTRLALAPLVHEVLHLTQPECVRQGVALHVEVAADLPPVVGDRVQVQQVLLNLVLNSLEALATVTERPREVWIWVRSEATDTVRVAVEDTGVGIAPEHLDQMFTAFYTTKAQGLGMGLAISRTIVEQHGGSCGRCRTTGRVPLCSLPCGRRPRRAKARAPRPRLGRGRHGRASGAAHAQPGTSLAWMAFLALGQKEDEDA